MRMYWGLRGHGKTLHLVYDAIYNSMNCNILDLYDSKDQVKNLNSLGYNFSSNYEHLCFSNLDINSGGSPVPGLRSYKVNPFKIGMPDCKFDTDIFPPGSVFYVTEAGTYWPSSMDNYIDPGVVKFFQTSRHYGVDFVIDCQRPMDIAKKIRDLCDEYIECVDVVHVVDSDGVVCGHKWTLRRIVGSRVLEEYLRTNNKALCEEYTEYCPVCLFDNYDSYFCRMLHLVGRQNQDFKLVHFGEEDDSDILTPPPGYFIQRASLVESKSDDVEGVIY